MSVSDSTAHPEQYHFSPEEMVALQFCPEGGLQESVSDRFQDEMRKLLRSRLRMAVIVMFFGFSGFLLQHFLVEEGHNRIPGEQFLHYLHIFVTSVLGVSTFFLCNKCDHSFRKLRIFEAVIFGLPAIFFIDLQYLWGCSVNSTDENMLAAYMASSVIPWLLLIHNYGLFIPNRFKRSAIVIVLMVLSPVVVNLVVASKNEIIADAMKRGTLSEMGLWLMIAAVTSLYGQYRFDTLRRQAFDAKRLGSYTLMRKIGAGGMGEVHLAEHRLLKRPCAIKLIRADKVDDPNMLARFESEVQATARLTHQNTVKIYDYGRTDDGTFYYAMELLPGLNLQEIVDHYGPLPPERVVHLLTQVCSALGEAHRAGLIHRDIKPGNIFSAERGGVYDVAKLLDFGLVKSIMPDSESVKLTLDGAVVGSPLYAAPETTIGDDEPDERSDIYSLGSTAYFLLTGKPPFTGKKPLKVIIAHVNETPALPTTHNPEIPEKLEQVLMKCLEKSPADRFANVDELGAALIAAVDESAWTQARAVEWWNEREISSSLSSHVEDESGLVATTIVDAKAPKKIH